MPSDRVVYGVVQMLWKMVSLMLTEDWSRLSKLQLEMCGIEKYRVVELPELEDPLQLFLKEISENARMRILKKELGEYYKYLEQLEDLENLSGVQARLPFKVDLQ